MLSFGWCRLSLGVIISLFSTISFAADEGDDEHEKVTKAHIGTLTEYGYRNFGPKFWKDVGGWNYPVYEGSDLSFEDPTGIAVPLLAGESLNRGALPSGWVPVPVNSNKTYYRAEYLMKSINGLDIDDVINKATAYYKSINRNYDPNSSYKNKESELATYKTLSKITIAAFPRSQFQLRFFPNVKLLQRERGRSSASGAALLASPRGGITMQDSYKKVSSSEYDKLVGIFKGTFTNEDAPGGKTPGLIVDYNEIDKPVANFATVALTANNEVKIGYVSDINLAEAKMLRQNEYLVLRKGEFVEKGAYPTGWNNYSDDIIRSYLAVSADGNYFAYVWTMYAHPSMLAATMQKMGFSDVMMLDIHPALAADFARPLALEAKNKYGKTPDFFSPTQSYGLVPHEDDANKGAIDTFLAWGASITRGRNMQWEPSNANGKSKDVDAEEDFFGVFINP